MIKQVTVLLLLLIVNHVIQSRCLFCSEIPMNWREILSSLAAEIFNL